MERKTYLSDVSDEEWSFVAPYLSLMTDKAPQRDHEGTPVKAAGEFRQTRRGLDR